MIVCLMDKEKEEREKQGSGRSRGGRNKQGGTAHYAVKPNGENSVKHTRYSRLLSASGLSPAFSF